MQKWYARFYCQSFFNGGDMERINLICFPHAGGNKMYYLDWKKNFSDEINLSIISYPMRDELCKTPMPKTIQLLVEMIFAQKKELFLEDYIIWGHSMGSIVGYEMAKKCKKELGRDPKLFFISGASAPCDYSNMRIDYEMPEKSLIDCLKKYGGMSEQVYKNREFRDYFFPIIREDFRLINEYYDKDMEQLNCQIIIMNGIEDDVIKENWQLYSNRNVQIWNYSGGHFFINNEKKKIIKQMENEIYNLMQNSKK